MTIVCAPERAILFRAAGAKTAHQASSRSIHHPWEHGIWRDNLSATNWISANKLLHNLSRDPLPFIGTARELLSEYQSVQLDFASCLGPADSAIVHALVRNLTPPLILLHTVGNSSQHSKSLPAALTTILYRALLNELHATVILLDWDNRVPRFDHPRIRHLGDHLGRLTIPQLVALYQRASLVIGVDSGPLHLCRCMRVNAIGIWLPGHHPASYSIPRPNQINVCLGHKCAAANRNLRDIFNLVEGAIDESGMRLIANTAAQMLSKRGPPQNPPIPVV